MSIDLHCDLLAYLQENRKNTPDDSASNCSIPQLKVGNVRLQVMALFTETAKGSTQSFLEQMKHFSKLLEIYADDVCSIHESNAQKITIAPAIENASGLLEEDEDFEHVIDRIESLEKICGPIAYVSLTWNGENRFGGGNETTVGLKEDGRMLLEILSKKKIPIDLSHTSDALAEDILSHGHHKIIASHSNYRFVCDVPRNLPNEFAKEIFKQGGVIGINLVRHFIGKSPSDIIRHIEHAISLGGEDHICLGSDFFSGTSLPPSMQYLAPFFFPEFSNSACHLELKEFLEKNFGKELAQKITSENILKGKILPKSA